MKNTRKPQISSNSLEPGSIVGGRYLLESLLGQGGMAVVFRARNTGTDRPCALKVIHPHLAERRGVAELFVREARVGGRIGDCPYIVDVFDAGVDEPRNLPFLAMELLVGDNLQHRLETEGALPSSLARTLFRQLAEALDQAHSASVVHRDLKPSNLFLTKSRSGEPVLKVLDFGIARILEGELHGTATEIGTPAYAAPEQLGRAFREIAAAQGVQVASDVSAATDLWALGLIAFEALTGLPAGQYWGAETASDLPLRMALSLRAHQSASSRAGDRAHLVPEGFDAWFARCLSIDARDRWRSAGEAVQALDSLVWDTRTVSAPARSPLAPRAHTQLAVHTFLADCEAVPSTPVARSDSQPLGAQTSFSAGVQTFLPQTFTPVPERSKPRARILILGLSLALLPVPILGALGLRALGRRPVPTALAVVAANRPLLQPPEIPAPPIPDPVAELERSCLSGATQSCLDVAKQAMAQEGLASAQRAQEYFQRACDAANQEGCNGLATILHAGKAGTQNKAEAVRLWTRACSSGYAAACKKVATSKPPPASTWSGPKSGLPGTGRGGSW